MDKIFWKTPSTRACGHFLRHHKIFGDHQTKFMKGEDENISAQKFRIGRWTPMECAAFDKAYKTFGHDWKSVSRALGTRSNVQCRTHMQKQRHLQYIAGKRKRQQQQLDTAATHFEESTMNGLANHAQYGFLDLAQITHRHVIFLPLPLPPSWKTF